jgi:type I restriction-modification system DNA methylase subunit
MWLDDLSNALGWPAPEQVRSPRGDGPKQYAKLVEKKIGRALSRLSIGIEVETGILTAAPSADTSEAPLAIVCQFSQRVDDEVLREAQRLAWNFTRVALLVTLEPDRIQAWTCALAPKKKRKLSALRLLPPLELTAGESRTSLLQTEVAQTLHWINLVSGAFFQRHEKMFRKEERADAMLVSNLRAVRAQLLDAGLRDNIEVCHSLLARLIFTQFLFQRKDRGDHPAISQKILGDRFDGALKHVYEHGTALEKILRDKSETYALFKWLNEKFNGDLFTGKGSTEADREREWRVETRVVTQPQLDILADFVAGKTNLETGQASLWPEYSFDTLPLEFISSVYEEFLNEEQEENSTYYTPSHLVDFVLDAVLPWSGTNWDLRVLDPCCGSGIFLVKSFQRLVQRWRNAHPGEDPKVEDLRGLLENNLMGVDLNPEAVRVASFSLCLALCDEIDPRYYWKRTLFPPLRGERLIPCDFFKEDSPGFRTAEDKQSWDLIVGNAPWAGGKLEDTALAVAWAGKHGWPVADKNVGPLFLAKAIALVKPTGNVSLILPAMPLLYQRSTGPTLDFRRKLFTSCTVDEVVSFTQLRAYLFPGISARACLITLQPQPSAPDAELTYICPGPQYDGKDHELITINPQDIHRLSHNEAINDPIIWSALLLGGRRDWRLIRRLSKETTLRKLASKTIGKASGDQCLVTREGIIRGKANQRDEPKIKDRRILESPDFPEDSELWLDAQNLKLNKNVKVHLRDSVEFAAFDVPQLLIKQTIIKETGHFRAAMVCNTSDHNGVIATQSYVSVHQFKGGDGWLRAACLSLNSRVATYFGLLSSSRIVANRAEALSGDILDMPLPPADRVPALDGVCLADVDELVEQAFALTEPESALIADMLDVVYREGGKEGNERPGRQPTQREHGTSHHGDLHGYAEFLVKALKASFGPNKAVKATIFDEPEGSAHLPLRMVALHLDWPKRRQTVECEEMNTGALRHKMTAFFRDQLGVRNRHGVAVDAGIGFQRIARLFITHVTEAGEKVPTVLFLKPDQRRFWTRSQALRDADDLTAAIMASGGTKRVSK